LGYDVNQKDEDFAPEDGGVKSNFAQLGFALYSRFCIPDLHFLGRNSIPL
jgi:hypothetical protein